LALFDFDDPRESLKKNQFEDIHKQNDSRMADTKFEDDNDN
jgi:hypothetical protein